MFSRGKGDESNVNFINMYGDRDKHRYKTTDSTHNSENDHTESFYGVNIKAKKPNISYAELIAEAIEGSKEGMLTLKEIYSSISEKYPYFSLKKTGWQNSIRHNLSLNKAFYKVPRGIGNPGKGAYWKLKHDVLNIKPTYRTRRMSNRYTGAGFTSEDFSSLSEILGTQQNFLDNIGVTEMPRKPNVTTIFDGNLVSLYDGYEQHYNFESVDQGSEKNVNSIFSFKR